MLKNPVCYLGVDVAKCTFVVACGRHRWTFANSPKGFKEFIAQIQKLPQPARVVCESTGPYHLRMCLALQKAGIEVSVMNAAWIRHHAKSEGKMAKNDPLDAKQIEKFAQEKQPAPTRTLSPAQIEICELLNHREHLVETVRKLKANRTQVITTAIRKEMDRTLSQLDRRILAIEEKLHKMVAADEEMSRKVDLLAAEKGVGFLTAIRLIVRMPELGQLNRGQCAALGGLAPFDDDSGTIHGKRSICGGRKHVRSALYMAAVSAAQHNPVLKVIYERLAATKPFKVAITAIMRKLLLRLNSVLKTAAAAQAG